MTQHEYIPDPHQDTYTKTVFGFWLYLMTDCILFSVLFATYILLHNSTFGGPTTHQLFDLKSALAETLILLTSSFTCGLAMMATYDKKKTASLIWWIITFALGIAFLAIELTEFTLFVQEGNSWQRSAFLSSFFTLVGTHGLHITTGLIWIIILVTQMVLQGFTSTVIKRLECLSMFWHFLDVVWIFIFTIVYLMGVA